jgi:hypothetical protein
MATCALTDLDESMCSHCRGLDPVPTRRVRFAITWSGAARFAGVMECGHRVEVGDPIGRTVDADYVCAECVEWEGCHYCDQPATTRDHIVPRSRAGVNEPVNVVPSCDRCNRAKGDDWPLCPCATCRAAVDRHAAMIDAIRVWSPHWAEQLTYQTYRQSAAHPQRRKADRKRYVARLGLPH